MMDFIRRMRDQFRSITPEVVAKQGNFILTAILIREMSSKLNMTYSLAAEIVGGMTIQVDNDAYHADPETFNETALAMVGVMKAMLDAYTAEFDSNAAYAFLKSAAKGMSLSYG